MKLPQLYTIRMVRQMAREYTCNQICKCNINQSIALMRTCLHGSTEDITACENNKKKDSKIDD